MGQSESKAMADMLTPLMEGIKSLIGMFQNQPNALNDTLQEIMKANEAQKKELAAARESVLAAVHTVTEVRNQEAAAKSRADAALEEAQKANSNLRQGIRPVVMPTEEQYQTALKKIAYSAEKFHFAICGTSGSGKSSLINAFRGVENGKKKAAAIGVTETTSKITRYPDARSELPYSRFVWYDIPGAGTTAVSDWQYFNDQGLFAFDFIVLVYDVRFTKIDVSIIENCYRFNIPVFIVRSKANQHIHNMMTELELDSPPSSEESKKNYEDIRARYIHDTRSDFDKHINTMAENPEWGARDRQMLLGQRVYIVSAINLRSLVLKAYSVDGIRGLIDEAILVEDLLRTATRRRYSEKEFPRDGDFRDHHLA